MEYIRNYFNGLDLTEDTVNYLVNDRWALDIVLVMHQQDLMSNRDILDVFNLRALNSLNGLAERDLISREEINIAVESNADRQTTYYNKLTPDGARIARYVIAQI